MEVNLETLVHLTLKEDFRRLVHEFSLKESFDVKDFVKMWTELDFPLIFSGLSDVEDMEYFTENAMIAAKDIFMDSEQNFDQIGAIYLLYILYFSQPLLKPVQIRIEHREFEKILEFCERMEEVTFDISYAIWKLLKSNAFAFVVLTSMKTEHQPTLNTEFETSDEAAAKSRTGSVDEEIRLISESVFESKFDIQSWGEEEDEYNKTMEAISKFDLPKPAKVSKFNPSKLLKDFVDPKSTSLVQERRKRKITQRQTRFEDLVRGKEESEEEENEPGENTTSLPLIEDYVSMQAGNSGKISENSSADSSTSDSSDWEDTSD